MTDPSPTIDPAPPARPFQYRLRTLLALPVAVAACAAIAHWLGIGVAILVTWASLTGLALYYRAGFMAVCVPTSALLVIACLISLFQSPRSTSGRNFCESRLQQLALALRGYHTTHGCFPPPYIAGKDGRPMHSWRVLILPQLGRMDLYRAYHFDEPWDGPNNRLLAATHVRDYECPSAANGSASTNYLAVVGPGSVWREGRSTKLGEITDGPANTILVVEVASSGVHWMEPRDLDMLPLAPGINPAGQGISSRHTDGANVVMADGSVRFLPDGLIPAEVNALLTIAGGEPTPSW
jgi:prepilin-type processing-associated H-X9-DG protein